MRDKLKGMKLALDVNGNIIVEDDETMSLPDTPRGVSGFGEKASLLSKRKMDYDEVISRSSTPPQSAEAFAIDGEDILVISRALPSSSLKISENPHRHGFGFQGASSSDSSLR